ncbi:MAG: hypothetical protein LBV04_09770, partial [Deferribacteraceae bacterium]|nr:hypothetical protein [Deferribacteraceae bacterium]
MIKTILGVWLLLVILQTASRIYLFTAYTTPEITAGYKADIARMFWVGAKYDMRVASIALILLMAIGLIAILTGKTYKLWLKAFPPLASIITFVIIFFTLSNIFYFHTFEHSIDVFAFSLIDDDTQAILATIWQDYPVLRFGIAILVAILLLYWLYRRWSQRIERQSAMNHVSFAKRAHPALALLVFLLVSALFFLGIRGSAGKFPLRRDNAQISTVQFINNLVPNALMSLDWAYGDYRRASTFPPATDEDGRRVLSAYFAAPTEPTLESFMADTRPIPPEAQATPPNVVFLLMESMGSNLSLLQNPDLLGNFRQHWEEDFVFTRFLSEVSGTIGAVNRLLIWSADENISMSRAQQTDFASNMLKPYLDAGYKVVYITSGSGSWRNLNVFVPNMEIGRAS